MFTLFDYIILGILGACFAAAILIMKYYGTSRRSRLITLICETLVFIFLIVGCAAYRTQTESGKRGLKTWESETDGGLNRTVIVYDIKGEEIVRYSGKFDIEESSNNGIVKIKFDDNGKRHIIYAQTGTVLIDEK